MSAWPAGLRVGICFLLGFGAVIAASAMALEHATGPSAALHERINAVRGEHHLIALRGSPELAAVALAHAEDMARRNFVAHVNPEGLDPYKRVQAAGVTGFRLLAENIGVTTVGSGRLDAVITEWLRSPSHRENLLNPAFNTSGIAAVAAPGQRTIYVQLFATY